MLRVGFALITTMVLTATVLAREEIAPPALQKSDPKTLIHATNRFALELHEQLPSRDGDLCICPISVSHAFVLMYARARSYTKEEMARVLHIERNDDATHRAFAAYLEALERKDRPSGDRLRLAAALWEQTGQPATEDFQHCALRHYRADLQRLDFESLKHEAYTPIGDWTAREATPRLTALFSKRHFDADTRLVLANAIALQRPWAVPFAAERTTQADFHLPNGERIDVPMMHLRARLRCGQAGGCRIVELPCLGRQFALIVVVPHEVESLAEFEKSLHLEDDDDDEDGKDKKADEKDSLQSLRHFKLLAETLDRLPTAEVRLSLPRFQVDGLPPVQKGMKRLGMDRGFRWGAASFVGRGGRSESVYISATCHQARVVFDEQGIEAAGATALIAANLKGCQLMGLKQLSKQALEKTVGAAPLEESSVVVDRPFLFLIRDRSTGGILFLGRVTHPLP